MTKIKKKRPGMAHFLKNILNRVLRVGIKSERASLIRK